MRKVSCVKARTASSGWGFTLLELLAAVAVIAILVALAIPALTRVQDAGKGAACVSNLHQIGVALFAYAGDNGGKIPAGPKAPPFTNPASFYTSTGAPTSLLSLQSGAPAALGLLLETYLAATPRVLFCPGTDQPVDASAELAKVGRQQAQGSYYYRHGGNTALFDTPSTVIPDIRLFNMGNNRNGQPVRALVLDTEFLCPPDLAPFNVKPRTHHKLKFVNILFSDSHVGSRSNADGRYTVDLSDYSKLRGAFDNILTVFERADADP